MRWRGIVLASLTATTTSTHAYTDRYDRFDSADRVSSSMVLFMSFMLKSEAGASVAEI